MLQSSYQKLKTAMSDGTQHRYLLAQQASLFYGGRMTDHIGAFIQATATTEPGGAGTDHLAMDNTDIRFAHSLTLGSASGTVGLSLNNNPTVTDVINTVPAWRFNYISPTLTPGVASPMLDGGLAGQVWGLNAYVFLNDSWYAELGGYQGLSRSFLEHSNVLAATDSYNKLDGTNPYWRLAYMHNDGQQFYSVGLFGMNARINPDGLAGTDKYDDVGVDGSYQLQSKDDNILALNTAYIYEKQTLDASYPAGVSANGSDKLRRFDLNASYHFHQTYGVTAGLFRIGGSADSLLYASGADSGFAGNPDTNGYILQADWTPLGKHGSWGDPWANLRLGLQYTWYTKFNGAANNYDGNGRNASDNNTLYAFVWTSF